MTTAPIAAAICTANEPTPPRGTDDEHVLPSPEMPVVSEGEERRLTSDRNRGRLLEAQAARLRRQRVGRHDRILGERSVTLPVHVVAGSNPLDMRSDGNDPPGHVGGTNRLPRSPQPERQPHHERVAGHEMIHPRADRRCVDLHQNLAVVDLGSVDLDQFEDVGAPVSGLDDGLHRAVLGRVVLATGMANLRSAVVSTSDGADCSEPVARGLGPVRLDIESKRYEHMFVFDVTSWYPFPMSKAPGATLVDPSAGIEVVDDVFDSAAGHLNAQHGRLVSAAVWMLDHVDQWQGDGLWTPEAYVRWRTGVAPATASKIVDVARAGRRVPRLRGRLAARRVVARPDRADHTPRARLV